MLLKKLLRNVVFHIFLVFILTILIIIGFFKIYLPYITRHGHEIVVPDFQGKTIQEIEKKLSLYKLRIQISDSVFSPDSKPFTVMSQYPKPGSLVKENRKIYLTVSTVNPPMIKMPNLVDASLHNAQLVLQSYGLKLGVVTKVPHYAENAVLKQYYKGREIKPGELIGKGSMIDLVVGDGVSTTYIPMPNLIGMKEEEALQLIQSLGLDIGSINYNPNSNQPPGIVIKQKPDFEKNDSIRQGESIDIWISGKSKSSLFDEQ